MRIPKLRRHATGQAHARIQGKDYYFGKWGKDAQARYDAMIAQWLAAGRAPQQVVGTVNQLLDHYLLWAQQRYATSRTELRDIRHALPEIRQLFGPTAIAKFSVASLDAVRQAMIGRKLTRRLINKRITKIKRIWKWAAQRKLLPAHAWHDLQLLAALREGESAAAESKAVQPVDPALVAAVLPLCTPPVAAMIRLQQWTGMRPGEVCQMRLCDIELGPEIWVYRLKFKRKLREIPLGPRAQFLLRVIGEGRSPEDYLFSPKDALSHRALLRSTLRLCAPKPVHISRRRKASPKRQPGTRYSVDAYAKSIAKACARLYGPFPGFVSLHFHPHQLRHTRATQIFSQSFFHAIDEARAALGHEHSAITKTYAHQDLAIAAALARQFG